MASVLDVWRARGTDRIGVEGGQITVDGSPVPRSRGFGANVFGAVGSATIPIAAAGMSFAAASQLGGRMQGSPTIFSGNGRSSGLSFDSSALGGELVGIGLDWIRGKLAGGSEGPSGEQAVPSAAGGSIPGLVPTGDCPGLTSVKIGDRCVDLGALPPGGRPAITGQVELPGGADGYGPAVKGWYGVGLTPRVEVRTVRQCPRGMALGKDGVCYDRGRLRKRDREWVPPRKPLLTGGERAAIAKAAAAGRKLDRARKGLKKASRALGKAC